MRNFVLKLSASLAICAVALSSHGGLSIAEAGSRYGTRQPVEAPAQARAAWLHQLKRAAPVNAAGVVFGGPIATRARPRQASRSIFSPDPFGQGQVVRQRRAAPRHVVQPGYARPSHSQVRPVASRSQAAPRAVAPQRTVSPEYLPQRVPYATSQKPGTIVIDTNARFLYHIEANGMAMRYGVGVGKPGFSWHGTHNITAKKQWPSWTPPKEMIAREKRKGRNLPAFMPGGEANPLGARALYLGSTLYRIHGTNQPWTIGQAVSSGCIRMRNQDVKALYEQVGVGTRVVVI